MARMARVVVPRFPHHVTQVGNRKQRTFVDECDYRAYWQVLNEAKPGAGVAIWAYCLMPNHVHLVVVPEHRNSLSLFFREVQCRYARRQQPRASCRGQLWRELFHAFAMDEYHLRAAVRSIELNPVREGLCHRPEHWAWSSVHAHLSEQDDELVTVGPMLQRVRDWRRFLSIRDPDQTLQILARHSASGSPLGDKAFLDRLARRGGGRLAGKLPWSGRAGEG